MRRKLSLLFFAASVALITACSNLTGPVRGEEDDDEGGDDQEPCGVVVGTQTRCDSTYNH